MENLGSHGLPPISGKGLPVGPNNKKKVQTPKDSEQFWKKYITNMDEYSAKIDFGDIHFEDDNENSKVINKLLENYKLAPEERDELAQYGDLLLESNMPLNKMMDIAERYDLKNSRIFLSVYTALHDGEFELAPDQIKLLIEYGENLIRDDQSLDKMLEMAKKFDLKNSQIAKEKERVDEIEDDNIPESVLADLDEIENDNLAHSLPVEKHDTPSPLPIADELDTESLEALVEELKNKIEDLKEDIAKLQFYNKLQEDEIKQHINALKSMKKQEMVTENADVGPQMGKVTWRKVKRDVVEFFQKDYLRFWKHKAPLEETPQNQDTSDKVIFTPLIKGLQFEDKRDVPEDELILNEINQKRAEEMAAAFNKKDKNTLQKEINALRNENEGLVSDKNELERLNKRNLAFKNKIIQVANNEIDEENRIKNRKLSVGIRLREMGRRMLDIARNMFSYMGNALRTQSPEETRIVQTDPAKDELQNGIKMAVRVLDKHDPRFAKTVELPPEILYFKLSEVLAYINTKLQENPGDEDLTTTQLEAITAMGRLRNVALETTCQKAITLIEGYRDSRGRYEKLDDESKKDLAVLRNKLELISQSIKEANIPNPYDELYRTLASCNELIKHLEVLI